MKLGCGGFVMVAVVAGVTAVAIADDGGKGGVMLMPGAGGGSSQNGAVAAAAPAAGAAVSCGSVALPQPGAERRHSKTQTSVVPIPATYKALYVKAGTEYGIPWQLLAAVGMIETRHGAIKTDSTVGAQGPMQFMPPTWAAYGVDGNGDGRKDVRDPADAIPAAAKYLVASGAKSDPKRALFAYNRAGWYVNDVLVYAHGYGATKCAEHAAVVGAPVKLAAALSWAVGKAGSPYVWGGTGPSSWDCSGLTQDTFRRAGINIPRTAEMQRKWLAAGNGTRVHPGQERPGDLLFSGTPAYHVVIVHDTVKKKTIEAQRTCRSGMRGAGIDCGVGRFDYQRRIDKGATIYRVNAAGRG